MFLVGNRSVVTFIHIDSLHLHTNAHMRLLYNRTERNEYNMEMFTSTRKTVDTDAESLRALCVYAYAHTHSIEFPHHDWPFQPEAHVVPTNVCIIVFSVCCVLHVLCAARVRFLWGRETLDA